jgi:acyl-CoA synthetase (AMP-forming)/AMP-acid ligase II
VDGVVEAAVIGVPDERWGEVGRAFVVRRTGSSLDAEQLLAACRRSLAKYKVPRSVVFLDALPKNAAGKIQKRALPKS